MSEDKWEKLPQIESKKLHIGCLNCSTASLEAPMDMLILVGLGSAYVEKDGKIIYDGEKAHEKKKKVWSVRDAEKLAAKDPDHDWRIVKYGPLHGETFQRHGPEKWVCIESNRGFA